MSYQSIILVQDTTLSWPYPAIPGLITIADINDVKATDEGLTLKLPAANNVGIGTTILFNNVGTKAFILADNEGNNLLPNSEVFKSGQVLSIYLTNNTTIAGVWKVIPFGGGTTAITSIGFTSTEILIDPSVITAPGGTVNLRLSTGLQNLIDINASGIPVLLEQAPLTWGTFEILPGPGGNILVTNGSAINGNVSANPTIDLSSTISGLNSLATTTLNTTEIVLESPNLSGTALIGTANNNSLNIITNGTGVLGLNGVFIDTGANINFAQSLAIPASGNITTPTINGVEDGSLTLNGVNIDSSQVITDVSAIIADTITAKNLTVSGTFNNSGIASAWVVFSDNNALSNNITIANYFNVASVTGGHGSYTITFINQIGASPLYSYAVNVTLFRGTEVIAPLLAYPTSPINSSQVNITTIDTIGNLLPVVDGVSVVIYGS